jgi:hypothetical protein
VKRLVLVFSLFLFSCGGSDDVIPSLTIKNDDGWTIIYVKLVGYEFDELDITAGTSKTFQLLNGINGGTDAVNVLVRWRCTNKKVANGNISVDFSNNSATITAKLSSSCINTLSQ